MRARFSLTLLTLATSAALALTGCGSDASDTKTTTSDASSGDTSGDSAGAGTDATATTDAGNSSDAGATDATVAPTKLCGQFDKEEDAVGGEDKPVNEKGFFLAVQAAPFGNLQLFFKATLIGRQTADGAVIKLFSLRGYSPKTQQLSDPMAAVCNVAVDKDGKFKADFGKIVLPALASPTSTDVKLSLVVTGQFSDQSTFCGDIDGDVPDFGVTLVGSKFKAVAFGTQGDTPESSCEGNNAKVYAPIAQCPVAIAGENTVTSAERERGYIVQLPEGVTDTTGLPVIFLYHGVGGGPAGMIKESFLTAEQQKTPFILVAPKSERGADGKAVLKSDWYYGSPQFDTNNPDLVFFDDLVKCLGAQYKFDTSRVYVTGMSGGGLMSTFLAVHRAKVVAAATPFSGGYLHAWPKESGTVPFVVSWGGPDDKAFEQNFNTMAGELIKSLTGTGHTVISCNHALKHTWPAEGGTYAAKFLLAHTLGKPSPFAAGLGEGWPSYCQIAK